MVIVAHDGSNIVGFLTAMITTPLPIFVQKKYGSLNDMFIKKKHRGRGLGERLLRTAVEWFQREGIKRIELRVDAKNEKAIAFYRAHGFTIRSYAMKKILGRKTDTQNDE